MDTGLKVRVHLDQIVKHVLTHYFCIDHNLCPSFLPFYHSSMNTIRHVATLFQFYISQELIFLGDRFFTRLLFSLGTFFTGTHLPNFAKIRSS